MPRIIPKPPIVRGVAHDCDCTNLRPHGTQHTYDYHSCGCADCCHAATTYKAVGRNLAATGRQRRRAAEPVRRRIELWIERGATAAELADMAGVSVVNIHLIRRGDRETVTTRTWDAIMRLRVPGRRAA